MKKRIFIYSFLTFVVLINAQTVDAIYSEVYVDSLRNRFENVHEDTLKIEILNELALIYSEIDIIKSKYYSDSALAIYYTIPQKTSEAINYKIAQCYRFSRLNKFAKSFIHDIYKVDSLNYDNTFNVLYAIELAYNCTDLQQYDSTAIYLNEAKILLSSNENISIHKHLNKAFIDYYINIDDFSELTSFVNNILFKKNNDQFYNDYLPQLIEILKLEFKYNKVNNATRILTYIESDDSIKKNDLLYSEILYLNAQAFINKKEINRAISLLMRAINYAKSKELNYFTTLYYFDLSKQYKIQNRIDSALVYADSSLVYARKTKDFNLTHQFLLDFAHLNKNYKNTKKGIEYLKEARQYKDSILGFYSDIIIDEKEAIYAVQAKQRDLDLIQKENAIKEAKVSRVRYGLFFLITITIFLIAILTYILEQRKIKSKQRISSLMSQNLRQQMNPHFVFNTLNSIQYFLFRNDKKQSNVYLSKFAHLLRLVISNSEKQFVALSEELKALELYMELEKLRFKDKIEYSIKLNGNFNPEFIGIPPMLLQPFIENAIIHGLMPAERKGEIDINFQMNSKALHCTIEDNGIGRRKSEELNKIRNKNHQSLGTKITENRIQLLNAIHKDNLQIKYHDLIDSDGIAAGTKVELYVPIKNLKEYGKAS